MNVTTDNLHWKRNFIILWTGQSVSVLTSSVLQLALIWHLTAATQSALVLSLASLAGFLPSAVLGLFAGTLVDRVSRKTALIGADLFIAAVSLSLVAAAWNGDVPVWLILTVLAARSVGTAFHTPAISAATPLIVPTEALTRCSGYIQSMKSVSFLVGTAAAGVLYPLCTISQMVALDVAGALTATLGVALIQIPRLEKAEPSGHLTDFIGEMKAGYHALKAERGLFALLWSDVFFMIVFNPVNALFPLMSLDYFGGTTFHASLAEIACCVGMLLAGLLLGAWGGLKDRGLEIIGSTALMGLPICLSGLLPRNGFWVFAFLCVVMGFSMPFFTGPVTALTQERIAPEYLGRVFGLYGSIPSLAMPIGLAMSGAFADKIGVHRWFLLSGLLCLLLTAVMYLTPSIRTIDRKPLEK